MRRVIFRSMLLGTTALAGIIAAGVPEPAQAQFYTNGPGFFLSLEGRYVLGDGSRLPNYAYADNGGAFGQYARYPTASSDGGRGPGGRLGLGYRFGNNWDIGLAIAGGRQKEKADAHSYSYTDPSEVIGDKLRTTLTYTNIDFEAGYNLPITGGPTLRLFGGVRFAYYKQTAKGTVTNLPFASSYHDYNGERKTRYYGVGPRIGANGTVPLGNSGLHLFGGLSLAALVGRLTDKHRFSYDSTGVFFPGGTFSYTDHKKTKLVVNGEGEIGLGYNFALGGGPSFGLQIGYRGEAVAGAASTGFVNGWYLGEFTKPKPAGDYLLHGPFARLVVSFGGGPAAPAASAAAPDAAGKLPVAFTPGGQAPLYTAAAKNSGNDKDRPDIQTSDAAPLTGAAPAVAANAAQDAPMPSLMPGFFGSITGWYYLNSGKDRAVYSSIFSSDLSQGATHPGGGIGGKVYFGYRLGQMFDVAVGIQGTRLARHRQGFSRGDGATDASYWAADGELGYNVILNSDAALRLFGGLRYAQFEHNNKLLTSFSEKTYENNYRGIGPRIGADFNLRLGKSDFSLFGDVAGAALFGRLGAQHQFENCASSADCTYHDTATRMVLNVEGQLGAAYEVAPGINIGVGYRAEYWNGVSDTSFQLSDAVISTGRGNRIMHGPFARLSYNFGPPIMAAMASTSPPPPPPVMAGKGFIVFFDFDRSNITAPAQKIINDAIAAAKAGGSTRVTLTGHTDRSGSEQYNQALSVRRGEAVKAAMIRGGIPANAIVVIGRGESAPLVPTADGVREPQNRRVEILI